MNPPLHRPKLVSRSWVKAELRKATKAAVSDAAVDVVTAEIEKRFQEILERAVDGRNREVELWAAQGCKNRSPRLEPQHIAQYTGPTYGNGRGEYRGRKSNEQGSEIV